MSSQTNSRAVLITGCSSGIGHHVAHRLLQSGYRVIASARQAEDVERLAEEGLHAVQLDLDDSQSIQRGLEQTLAITNGQLFCLFNNGAYGQPGAVEDLSRQALREQLETNLLGWHELTNLVLPVMRRQGEGRIIYNSSLLGYAAMPYRGAYNCSKYALEGLVDTLRLELRGTGIHLSLVEPGPILSRFRANAVEKFRQHIDVPSSPHRAQYEAMQQRLTKQGAAAPFTLPPEAVFTKVLHALESKRPRVRYPVTVPAHLFAWLKRLLPARMLDSILLRASGDGKR